jgi:hypothetical protein
MRDVKILATYECEIWNFLPYYNPSVQHFLTVLSKRERYNYGGNIKLISMKHYAAVHVSLAFL